MTTQRTTLKYELVTIKAALRILPALYQTSFKDDNKKKKMPIIAKVPMVYKSTR
jgi:hypothetical protein